MSCVGRKQEALKKKPDYEMTEFRHVKLHIHEEDLAVLDIRT